MLFKDSSVVLLLNIVDEKLLHCVYFPAKSLVDMTSFLTFTSPPLKQGRVDLKIPSVAKVGFSDSQTWQSMRVI